MKHFPENANAKTNKAFVITNVALISVAKFMKGAS